MRSGNPKTLRRFVGLLVGLSLLPADSKVRLTGRLESLPYSVGAQAGQLSPTNSYGTGLLITHLDISLKTDFRSNSVPAVVLATLENTSPKPLDKAAFHLCTTGNDRHFRADVRRIQFLEETGEKQLQYIIREVPDPGIKDRQTSIYEVPFSRPVRPGERVRLRFEYTMAGQPDHSGAPIEQSKKGIKEIYLRGGDYRWCPSLYRERKTTITPDRLIPTWTLIMESPKGYVAVTDGELVRRGETNDWAIDEWKSLSPGVPHLYVGPYQVASRTFDGVTFEIYAPDGQRLQKAAAHLEKYARMFNLYSELYGNLGLRTYRIVCSSVAGVGVGFISGQTIDLSMMNDTLHVAHEMAHAWWGHWFSPHGPGFKFLTEAMAEFSARWVVLCAFPDEDRRFDDSLADDFIVGWKQRQFCCYFPVTEPVWRSPVPLIPQPQESYDPYFWNYNWGPLVVNHVRLVLGNETFFRCLKSFLGQYGGKRAGIEEFIQTIQTVSGIDMTAELRGLLWTTGCASYRAAGFASVKTGEGYRTSVRIQNEGDYGLTCPLLLKTIGGDTRGTFKVDGKQEKEFVFTTAYKVIDVVIDPDLTALQYHPEQKLRLWRALLGAMESYGNNEAFGKSYIYYALGEPRKAVNPISDYLRDSIKREKVNGIDELLKKSSFCAPYVFMRGVFYLGLDDFERAEEDVKSAFPYMLRALVHKDSVRVPGAYYEVGAITQKDLGEYLKLLGLITGREFSFGSDLDESAKKRKVEKWQQWWAKEGKHQKLDLGALKERCETQRKAFREQEVSLRQKDTRTGE